MNECSACNQQFGSLTAFDMHRVGKHAYLASPEQPDGRRCLTAQEMEERGMRLDANGRWRSPSKGVPWWKNTEAESAGEAA